MGLSNIGDAILMSPVIAQLHARFPQAHLTLLVGERARAVFERDPRIHRLVCMEEFDGILGRLRLVPFVWQVRPDLLVDLRQTILPVLWKPWRAWRYVWPVPRGVRHMRQRHLLRLARQLGGRSNGIAAGASDGQSAIWISPEEQRSIDQLLTRWGLDPTKRLVVVSPGARSHIKRWDAERFAKLADRLIEQTNSEVILTGEPDEASVITEVCNAMRRRAHNAVGQTTIRQLAALLERAALVITNDSAALQTASRSSESDGSDRKSPRRPIRLPARNPPE